MSAPATALPPLATAPHPQEGQTARLSPRQPMQRFKQLHHRPRVPLAIVEQVLPNSVPLLRGDPASPPRSPPPSPDPETPWPASPPTRASDATGRPGTYTYSRYSRPRAYSVAATPRNRREGLSEMQVRCDYISQYYERVIIIHITITIAHAWEIRPLARSQYSSEAT